MDLGERIRKQKEKEALEKSQREADIERRVQEALTKSEEKELGITGREAPKPQVVGGGGNERKG